MCVCLRGWKFLTLLFVDVVVIINQKNKHFFLISLLNEQQSPSPLPPSSTQKSNSITVREQAASKQASNRQSKAPKKCA